jgi:leader peptidase (prepilin peptidase) / N-methyltransferase
LFEDIFLITVVSILGLLLGSFANVFIYRWPRSESVVTPRSRCQKCAKQILWYHNIPVISWLVLRGQCAFCRAPISPRYVLVELLMTLLFGLAAWTMGPSPKLLEALPFIFAVVTASFIDLDHYLLPDILTLSGIVIGLAGAVINPDRSFTSALIGVLVGGGVLWAIAFSYYFFRGKEGLGGGDIKLLAWIGAVLGWQSLPFTILFASVTGAIIGSIVAVSSKQGFGRAIPFGPFLAVGALLYLFGIAESWTLWYFQLHGLDLPH